MRFLQDIIDILKHEGQKLCKIIQMTIMNDIHEIRYLRMTIINDVFDKFLLYWILWMTAVPKGLGLLVGTLFTGKTLQIIFLHNNF